MTGYEAAKAKYEALGVDTDRAIERLKKVPVSLHCWQLDDVIGFDNDGGLTGGIQTTGNYPGRARTPQQLMEDMEEAMKLMPGTAKLNIHASYAIFEPGEFADRDALEPKHFAKWVEFARKHHMGIDFNPTFFSHEKVKDGRSLPSHLPLPRLPLVLPAPVRQLPAPHPASASSHRVLPVRTANYSIHTYTSVSPGQKSVLRHSLDT